MKRKASNPVTKRRTEQIASRRIPKSEMKTISRKDLERTYRHMMQVIPALNDMREIMGKKPIIVPED
jgi:hypothetical protein